MIAPMSIVIVGTGYMGSAIVHGLKRSSPTISIVVVETDAARRAEMSKAGIPTSIYLPNPITSDALILAIPPQAFLKFSDNNHHIKNYAGAIVSVMAGISINELQARLRQSQIYRAIPNLPCAVNEGMTVLIPAPHSTQDNDITVTKLFSRLGSLLFVEDESLIDNATALVGGGPAYISYFAAALIEYAETSGFDKASATLMVTQLLTGTSSLLESSQDPPMRLCEKVMTPGGTTQQAIKIFDDNQLGATIITGLKKSCARSTELGKRP